MVSPTSFQSPLTSALLQQAVVASYSSHLQVNFGLLSNLQLQPTTEAGGGEEPLVAIAVEQIVTPCYDDLNNPVPCFCFLF